MFCSRLSGRLIDSAVSIAGKSFVGELDLIKNMIDAIKTPGDSNIEDGGWGGGLNRFAY